MIAERKHAQTVISLHARHSNVPLAAAPSKKKMSGLLRITFQDIFRLKTPPFSLFRRMHRFGDRNHINKSLEEKNGFGQCKLHQSLSVHEKAKNQRIHITKGNKATEGEKFSCKQSYWHGTSITNWKRKAEVAWYLNTNFLLHEIPCNSKSNFAGT